MYYIYFEELEKNASGKWESNKISEMGNYSDLGRAYEDFKKFGGRYLPDMLNVYACVNSSSARKSGFQVYLTEGLIKYEDLCEVLDVERCTWDDLYPDRS